MIIAIFYGLKIQWNSKNYIDFGKLVRETSLNAQCVWINHTNNGHLSYYLNSHLNSMNRWKTNPLFTHSSWMIKCHVNIHSLVSLGYCKMCVWKTGDKNTKIEFHLFSPPPTTTTTTQLFILIHRTFTGYHDFSSDNRVVTMTIKCFWKFFSFDFIFFTSSSMLSFSFSIICYENSCTKYKIILSIVRFSHNS